MSSIDDAAKDLRKKADRTIARNLGAILWWLARYGAAFALGAYLL